jgi:hypothetical protein
MKSNSLILSAGFAALASLGMILSPVNAEEPAVTGHEVAIKACSTVNPKQPVEVLNAVDDGTGIGFSLVWMKDADGNLWMCDADSQGNVYTYTILTGDLLAGTGPELIGLQPASNGTLDGDPKTIAEKVCIAHLEGGGKVLVSAPDGLDSDPGFIVFVQDAAGGFHLCNATGDAMIWAFEPVGDPIKFETQTS